LSVPDEDHSRNLSCTLNLISTFLFQMTGVVMNAQKKLQVNAYIRNVSEIT
jgi:hypothetical protein